MQHTETTPVPNVLFDVHLKKLKSAELKVLLVIIRQTLGWADRRAVLGRKEMDWISGGQLQVKTGSSRHAISSAIESLVSKRFIEVLDESGNLLCDPSMRKGKLRLFYRLTLTLFPSVDILGKTSAYPVAESLANAKFAQDVRKKVTGLVQKMRITKETLQN